MTLSSEQEQIKLSFEQLKMTPAEIAQDRSLEEEAVKACLMAISPTYRKMCRHESDEEEPTVNFTEEQHKRAVDRIFDIAVSSENESIALRAAMFIRDDKKGRRDAVKALAGVQFNVLQFNEQIRQAAGAVERALGLKQEDKQKAINV